MWLSNVYHAEAECTVNIAVQQGHISSVNNTSVANHEPALYFEDATVIPGLINSHDHLDFNIFPQLGNRVYDNYTGWGKDIHLQNKTIIDAVLKIPVGLRATWGLYKNLLAGVTTVLNHGKKLQLANDMITVHQKPLSLHSVAFEKNWKYKLNNPLGTKQPVVIHAGEGTDEAASKEITSLYKWNRLHKKLVAVHGVAMSPAQAKHFEALVWCPASNLFLLDKTAPVQLLQEQTKILFGTDSTLTAHWDIWEHLRMALQTKQLNAGRLWKTVTATAATVWQLNKGTIAAGKEADIVVLKGTKKINDGTVFSTRPEDILLVMHKGAIRLFDASLLHSLQQHSNGFSRIHIGKTEKYVYGNLPALLQEILNYYPHAKFPVTAG